MLIRCVNRGFRDLATKGKPWRKVGDVWEATPERLAQINSSHYGVMAEAVEDGQKPEPDAAVEPEATVGQAIAEEPEEAPKPKRRGRKRAVEG